MESSIDEIEILPHVLFNALNQANPILLLDCRENQCFLSCRIRKSVNFTIGNRTELELEKLITQVYLPGSLFLIFVTENSNPCEELANFQRRLQSSKLEVGGREGCLQLKSIKAIKLISFAHFFAKYGSCISVFEGSEVAPIRPGLIKYFPTEIIPDFLFLGDYRDGSDDIVLANLKVTHLIDASGERLSEPAAMRSAIEYFPLRIWDLEGVNIRSHFESVTSFIRSAREQRSDGRVLVHCRAGISRAATLVLAYLMESRIELNLKNAFKSVVEKRPFVCPNASFRQQLREYEEFLFESHSFADDAEMMAFKSTIDGCWSGIFTMETDHDRVPIVAGRKASGISLASEFPAGEDHRAEYPDGSISGSEEVFATSSTACDGKGATPVAKPKKPFLKRGQGKRAYQTKEPPVGQATDDAAEGDQSNQPFGQAPTGLCARDLGSADQLLKQVQAAQGAS